MFQAERRVALGAAPDVIGAEGAFTCIAIAQMLGAGRVSAHCAARQRCLLACWAAQRSAMGAGVRMLGADGVAVRADVSSENIPRAD